MRLRTLLRTSVLPAHAGATWRCSASSVSRCSRSSTGRRSAISSGRRTPSIQVEIDGLSSSTSGAASRGLADIIASAFARDDEHRSVYLLADALGRPLAGNLRYLAAGARRADRPVARLRRTTERGASTPVRARVFASAPACGSWSAATSASSHRSAQLFARASIYGLTLTMGARRSLGGVLMALSARRRLADLNRTTRQIIAGDLSRRAPLRGSGDEHDELAGNINAMLDQIESLLERHAPRRRQRRSRLARTAHAAAQPARDARRRRCSRGERISSSACEQVEHVLDTFNALLRIARVESGAHRSAFAALDLERIVRDVCELYQAAADERQIDLVCSVRRGRRGVRRSRAARAGAHELARQRGQVHAGRRPGSSSRSTRTDDIARISVADSGPGHSGRGSRTRAATLHASRSGALAAWQRSRPCARECRDDAAPRPTVARRQLARPRRHDRDPGADAGPTVQRALTTPIGGTRRAERRGLSPAASFRRPIE